MSNNIQNNNYITFRNEKKKEIEKYILPIDVDMDLKLFSAKNELNINDYNNLIDINNIKQTNLYKIIRNIPKMTLFHLHIFYAIDPIYFINVLKDKHPTLYNKLYFNTLADDTHHLLFIDIKSKFDNWTHISSLNDLNKINFIQMSKNDTTDLSIWTTFNKYIYNICGLFRANEVFDVYIKELLTQYYQDKIYYIELRGTFDSIYEIMDNPHNKSFKEANISDQEIRLMISNLVSTHKFLNKHIVEKDYKFMICQFKRILFQCLIIQEQVEQFNQGKLINMTIRLIITLLKGYNKKYLPDPSKYEISIITNQKVLIEKVIVIHLINEYVGYNLFVGYDMVMSEKMSNKIKVFGSHIQNIDSIFCKHGIKFIPHAGESTNVPKMFNENMFDSILLNSFRIAHGFNIAYDYLLLEYIKKNNIILTLELCPISNIVFKYFDKLNNHSAITLLHNNNIKITLNNDNPGTYGYNDMSTEYALVTLFWQLKYADIKKIIVNGLDLISNPNIQKYYVDIFSSYLNS
jgi:hypothetical protein